MRISDWSSDVCSSDLLAAEPEAPAEAPTVEEPADEAPAEDFAEEEEPAAEAAAADQFDAMPDVHDEATGPELLTPASGDLSEEGALEEEDDTPERSEEHTSELQSLMRIPYAVFCFKTKNTI